MDGSNNIGPTISPTPETLDTSDIIVENGPVENEVKKVKKPGKGKFIVILILILLVAGGSSFGGYYFGKKSCSCKCTTNCESNSSDNDKKDDESKDDDKKDDDKKSDDKKDTKVEEGTDKNTSGKENDENRIHEGWRLQQPKSSNGERSDTTGQIRQNEIQILEGTQESRTNNISDEQGIVETPNGDSRSSNKESEPDSNGYGRETENNGRIESEQSNALGTGNEQLETDGRGTSNEGTNLRLSIYTPSDDAPGYVVTDSKINQILATTPYINKHSKEIIDFFEYEKDINSRANYIKSIFNIDYTEIVIDDTRYGYKTFENGVLFWKDAFLSRTAEELVKWEDLTKHFEAMILLNQLKEQYEKPKTVADQMTLIEESKQENGFDFEFTQEFIDRYLQEEGTEFKYGIYEYFNSSLSQKENIDYLKRIT